MPIIRYFHSPGRKIPGQLYLWLAILIFGASSAITRKLTEIGAQNLVNGRNPISLCNVLFVGNLTALIVLAMLHWHVWNRKVLRQLSRQEWVNLVSVAILSGAIAPSLIFQALALTQVNNVILVGRLEPPLTLALSVWFLREQVNGWQVGGAMAALIGVALTIMLQPAQTPMVVMGNRGLGSGELLATIGAIALAISTIIGKRHLSTVPIGIYSIVRTGLGTVIFFVLASVLYGWEHFMDARSPFLWQWMLIYGVIIVALGQSFWITGLRASSVSTASIIGSFTPIAGILAAYLILGEPPTSAQYIGGSMILAGICLSQIGNRLQPTPRLPPVRSNSMPVEQAIDVKMGFKGI